MLVNEFLAIPSVLAQDAKFGERLSGPPSKTLDAKTVTRWIAFRAKLSIPSSHSIRQIRRPDSQACLAESLFRPAMNAHPVRTLTLWFWSWKLLLLLIVLVSPGPGYDTSTSILAPISRLQLPSSLLKFVRWDSIYFVNIAQRGYLYEQEWAFGYGYVLSILSAG